MEENTSSSSENAKSSKNWLWIGIAVFVLIVLVAGGGYFYINNQKSKIMVERQLPSTVPEQNSQTMPTSQTSNYKDGTYSAEGKYTVHAGDEQIGVKITLKNGLVTDVVVIQEAKLPMSKTMQADFAANYKPMVIGKNIDTLVLGKVSGSSLTPLGFNDAVEQIKAQAKS
jgi:uncharacterized protein with FMN-binding domain